MNECPSCHSALMPESDFAFCATCGLLVSDQARADAEIAELRQTLRVADDFVLDRPNVLPALVEGAWWELASDRAVHFTPGSLARCARSSGFDVLELSLSGDERQLHLTAVRTAGPTSRRLDREDDLATVTAAVDAFPAASERQVARWTRVIQELLGEDKRVALLGDKNAVESFISRLQIDEKWLGRTIDAVRPPDVVIALGDAAADVRRQLQPRGPQPLLLAP